ncbi:uncharacterized protein LOC114939768 [Nylanderia fulva]|uniref:uncharacterized protein LOC114939768 n=1 Tax=Nylanderia fulva TaxID=613905 RepID=UPI0010FB8488|nr:uncharacterized protein LOC114939768 [Nylanderia fulva]
MNNTYNIDNSDVSSNANGTYVIDNISSETSCPVAESTLIENQLDLECEIHNNNSESDDTSITSKNNLDSSFHLSDCSKLEDTDEDEDENETKNTHERTINTSKNKSVNRTLNLTSTFSSEVCDDRNMYVETSNNPKLKQNMCVYCEKFQAQIARHLETVHKEEEDVKKFRLLPKGNPERKKIIGLLRRKGNFIYNTNSNLNKGDLIVCRRPRNELNRQAADFIPCAKCKGFFSKNNIRHHFASCAPKREYPQRNVKILGRTVACRIHYSANTPLRRLVFPVMREDSVTQIIRYDELLIAFGNKMCQKYRLQHQHDMIRARLRLLGRFLIVLRDLDNSIVDFSSIYNPTNYEQCIKAVNKLAQFDEKTWTYKIPSIATSLGTLIKQIGKLLRSICIKKQDCSKQTVVENFLKLFEEDYPVAVNKIVFETQGHRKRQKNIVLPSIDDIKIFNAYLKAERIKALESLQTNGFSIHAWRMLTEITLISIMIFNRRRAGELERVLIENLENCAAISKEEAPELYKSLSKYVRMTIRGKLGRTVPVLLHEEILKCMQMIINYRKDAGVPENNPYIFGIYSLDKRRFKYLRACVLMRKYSVISGAKMPTSLRGTILRKHIATVCMSLDISEHEVNNLADFMGHHEKIHKSHYRQSIVTKDLAISRLLKYAQGGDTTDESDNVDDENENRDDSINNDNSNLSLNTSDTLSLIQTRSSKLPRLLKYAQGGDTTDESDNVDDENENGDDSINNDNSDLSLNTSDTLSLIQTKSSKLPSKEKIINNHLHNNIEKTKGNRLASKRKVNYNIKNVTESDDECNTESDLNILSKRAKQSEQVTRGKNNVNNNTQRQKKRMTSVVGSTRNSTHKIRWTDDERTIVLSSFQPAIKNKKLPSLREINEIKIKYPVLKARTSAQIKSWLHNQIRKNT